MGCAENIAEAKRMLVEKPLLATSAEHFLIMDEIKSSWMDEPQPKRFAHALATLLARVSVPLEPYDLIAGRCVDRELTSEEEAAFQQYIRHPDHPRNWLFLSSGHCTYSWEMVVEKGIPGLRAMAQERLHSTTVDSDQCVFLESILEIYDALTAYMLRYAQAAEDAGMMDLAQSLRTGAIQKPDSFRSALQLLWIVTFIDCSYITANPTLTVGRLDQILYPLYQADLEKGVLTRETAAACITDYYCKHNLNMGRGEHQVGDASNSTTFSRILNFDAPQYLLLAGTDGEGKPAVNELTKLFAECIQPAFKNPVVVVRYFKGMASAYPGLWDTLMEKALQSASLMFYNDNNVLAAYERLGIPEADRRKYEHFGCNWPTLGEDCAWLLGGPKSVKYRTYHSEQEAVYLSRPYMRSPADGNWPEVFLNVLRELTKEAAATIDDFYRRFLQIAEAFVDEKLLWQAKEMEARKRRPAAVLTFGDCFLRRSLQDAACISAAAKYHFELQSYAMLGTVSDCFTTVDQLVYRDHRLTLTQLLEAVDANFEGHEDILALCRSVPKYGSDSPLSNAHVERLTKALCDMTIQKSRPYVQQMGLYLAPCIQSDTWHLKVGEQFGATPDGRLAYTPFSQNSRPSNGACTNGLTGMFNAMLHLPSDGILSGALNLDADPRQFAGEHGRKLFGTLLSVYFDQGGLHAQISSASVDDLIDAQKNPYLHRDLRVRVTGYSGIFVDISKRLQDDIIQRFS